MRKLLFGKSVETEKAWCDMCDEDKECFIGETRRKDSLQWEYETDFEYVSSGFSRSLKEIVTHKKLNTKTNEFTFHICPDCVKQLNGFIKDLNSLITLTLEGDDELTWGEPTKEVKKSN